jgi:hypothetical protein
MPRPEQTTATMDVVAAIRLADTGLPDPQHPTVTLPYQGQEIQIDADLAPLLTALWAHGVQTSHCCQGGLDPNGSQIHEAYITFATPPDVLRFVQLSPVQLAVYVAMHFLQVGGEEDGVPVTYLDEIPEVGNSIWYIKWSSEHTPAVTAIVQQTPVVDQVVINVPEQS